MYSKERFLEDPEGAYAFLEKLEEHSYKLVDEWKEYTQAEIVKEATFRLHCLELDIEKARDLQALGMVH